MILSRIGKKSAGARHLVRKLVRLSHVRTYGTTISPRSIVDAFANVKMSTLDVFHPLVVPMECGGYTNGV